MWDSNGDIDGQSAEGLGGVKPAKSSPQDDHPRAASRSSLQRFHPLAQFHPHPERCAAGGNGLRLIRKEGQRISPLRRILSGIQ